MGQQTFAAGPGRKHLRLWDQRVSVTTTQLHCYVQMHRCGCAPMKLYLQKQAAAFGLEALFCHLC